ncbi:cytochrome c oxidase assembly protein COX20, mitochondrial isoform X3 [Urocitellus parryii]
MKDSVIRPIEQKRWQPRRQHGLCVALRTFPKMAAGARGRAGASGRGAAGLASAPEALDGRKVGLEEPTGPHGCRAGAGRVREGEANTESFDKILLTEDITLNFACCEMKMLRGQPFKLLGILDVENIPCARDSILYGSFGSVVAGLGHFLLTMVMLIFDR